MYYYYVLTTSLVESLALLEREREWENMLGSQNGPLRSVSSGPSGYTSHIFADINKWKQKGWRTTQTGIMVMSFESG